MRSSDQLGELVTALLESEAIRDAVVADGWPRPMVDAGFELHRRTWSGDHTALFEEVDALPDELRAARLETISHRTIAHLWPALPGAGVTPVLHAWLLGVERQLIRASSRGRNFAEALVEIWRDFDDTVSLTTEWTTADHVVVSGSDETVEAVVREVGEEHVIGYGHRVSGAVVVDDGDAGRWAESVARDVVMWDQLGCFSARGIVFVGEPDRARDFSMALADAIARLEERWSAMRFDDSVLAERMQRLGRAEFETEVFRSGLGWVERRSNWDGEWIAPHALSLCVVRDISMVTRAIVVPPANLQGIAVATDDKTTRKRLTSALVAVGATRVCDVGELQAPESSWPHDGYSNVEALAGPGVGRVGDNTGAQRGRNGVG